MTLNHLAPKFTPAQTDWCQLYRDQMKKEEDKTVLDILETRQHPTLSEINTIWYKYSIDGSMRTSGPAEEQPFDKPGHHNIW